MPVKKKFKAFVIENEKKHGNEWEKFKEKFEIEVKALKSKN